jgi:hypothetical protein
LWWLRHPPGTVASLRRLRLEGKRDGKLDEGARCTLELRRTLRLRMTWTDAADVFLYQCV